MFLTLLKYNFQQLFWYILTLASFSVVCILNPLDPDKYHPKTKNQDPDPDSDGWMSNLWTEHGGTVNYVNEVISILLFFYQVILVKHCWN